MRITTFAAIYVGSYEVSLKITEISAKRKIREIDLIRSRIGIGRNIYKHKKVETEVMEELCEILSEYEEIMKSYRVDAYRVYAGAFLKDAGNVLFVLEQIRIRTGLTLQILSNSERRFIGYQSVAAREEFDAMTKEGAADHTLFRGRCGNDAAPCSWNHAFEGTACRDRKYGCPF